MTAMKEPEHGSGGAVLPTPTPAKMPDGNTPVLVAVDFSADSEDALVWAYQHAKRLGVPLEVLHVVHDPADAPGTYRSDNGDLLEPISDVAERKLGGFLDEIADRRQEISDRADLNAICITGLPVETILRCAQERGAQQLVVGCRGRKGAARLLFGSTSQRVAQKAKVPVTIVKANGK